VGILDELDDVGKAYLHDLVDQIKRGECVLFLGSGVSTEVGLPSGEELTRTLAQEVGVEPISLSQVAQEFERTYGRAKLIQRIKQLIIDRPVKHNGVTSYDLLPEINGLSRMIFTTNWDNQIENAFERKQLYCNVVRYNHQIGLISDNTHTVIKLHGDLGGNPKDIVLTPEDYKRAYNQVKKPGRAFSVFGTKLLTNTILFVGYSLEDKDFQLLYRSVKDSLGGNMHMHYAVMIEANEELKKKWKDQEVAILQLPARALLEYIAHQVRDFVNRVDESKEVIGPNAQPFTEFYGIAGNGKTELLKKIEEHYRLAGDWLHAYVSFEKKDSYTSVELAEELCRQTSIKKWKDPLQRAEKEAAV